MTKHDFYFSTAITLTPDEFDAIVDQCASEEAVWTGVVKIKPDLASHMLTRNHANRNISKRGHQQLETDVQSGAFTLNGESIVIANTGELNDGQHRLETVVSTKRPITTVLVIGTERDSRMTIDTGMARTAGNIVKMFNQQPYATNIAAVSRLILNYEFTGGKKVDTARQVSKTQIVTRALEDAEIASSVEFATTMNRQRTITIDDTTLAFCHYVLRQANEQMAEEYLHDVVVGANLDPEAPAFTARKRIATYSGKFYRNYHKMEAIFKGWNDTVLGTTSRFKITGTLPEILTPEPIAEAA